jgi:hypothetical protein
MGATPRSGAARGPPAVTEGTPGRPIPLVLDPAGAAEHTTGHRTPPGRSDHVTYAEEFAHEAAGGETTWPVDPVSTRCRPGRGGRTAARAGAPR